MPPLAPGRERRLQDGADGNIGEEGAIRLALSKLPDDQELLDIFNLGLLTGMRRGEILTLTVDEVQRAQGVTRL